jgi:hypothetical protein
MTDFMVKLPDNFRYTYQFDGNSQYKCVEASLTMAGQVAYPDRYPNPHQLMSQIYQKYVGPDVAGDRNGTSKEQALDWLRSQNIGFIDMQHYIDSGDIEGLHQEIQAQNKQDVCQIFSIGDESFLKSAKTGHTLHNWADALNHGSHTMLRVGYSDSEGWAYYMEPAAAPNFAEPVPITWQDFLDGKIDGCIAIMPKGVKTPPADFSFLHGTWPTPPKPPLDVDKAQNTIAAMINALDAMKTAMGNLGNDLNTLKTEV